MSLRFDTLSRRSSCSRSDLSSIKYLKKIESVTVALTGSISLWSSVIYFAFFIVNFMPSFCSSPL